MKTTHNTLSAATKHRLTAGTLVAALAITLAACQDDTYTGNAGNFSPGQLGIAEMTLDGANVTVGRSTRTAAEAAQPNTAISALSTTDVIKAEYTFKADAADAPYTATISGTNGTGGTTNWTMTPQNSAPLKPNATSSGDYENKSESWAEANATFVLTTGTANGNVTDAPGIVGGTVRTDAASCMNYTVDDNATGTSSDTDVTLLRDILAAAGDQSAAATAVRSYFDAVAATSDADANTKADATATPGTLTIDRDPDSPKLGAIRASLAHTGAMMRLTVGSGTTDAGGSTTGGDLSIASPLVYGGKAIEVPALTQLWAEVEVEVKTTGGSTGATATFFVPFTQMTLTGTGGGTSSTVWQAIIPGTHPGRGITAVVKRFVARVTGTEPGTGSTPGSTATPATASFIITPKDADADGTALQADYRYAVSLTLGATTNVSLTLPAGKPGWGNEDEEEEMANWKKHLEVTYGGTDGVYTYTVKTAKGLKAVADWINNGGTPPMKVNANDPDYDGTDLNTATADRTARLKTNITLAADIDMTAMPTDATGSNWTAIGTSGSYTPYTGTFDGAGKTVTGIVSSTYGFFSDIASGAVVKNLTLKDGTITGNQCTGGIVGNNNNGIVTNCHFVGGSVTDTGRVGGIVGQNYSGTVVACTNSGAIKATHSSDSQGVGGIVGYNYGSATVIACGNTGNIKNTENDTDPKLGGVVGYNNNASSPQPIASYTTVGKVLGSSNGNIADASCFPKDDASFGSNTGTGYAALNADANITAMNDAIFDYNNGQSTAAKKCLFHFVASTTPATTAPTLAAGAASRDGIAENGTGSNDAPHYDISTAAGLATFATIVNKSGNNRNLNATLTADITLPATGDSNWTPIATRSNSYTGTFDGAGYTISNLTIYKPDADYQGLFSAIGSGAVVKNVTVTGSITGQDYVAGIVGYSFSSTVTNCHNRATVSSDTENASVGGVVGCIYNSSNSNVIACTNSGAITVNTTTNATAGGVVGFIGPSTSNVIACINTGTITTTGSNAWVGGVIGYNGNGSTVTACYSTGKISGNATGYGVVDRNYGTGTACYWQTAGTDRPTTGTSISGGATAIDNCTAWISTTEGSAMLTMNAAIANWNTANADNADKQCPYTFKVNDNYDASSGTNDGYLIAPLILEATKKTKTAATKTNN